MKNNRKTRCCHTLMSYKKTVTALFCTNSPLSIANNHQKAQDTILDILSFMFSYITDNIHYILTLKLLLFCGLFFRLFLLPALVLKLLKCIGGKCPSTDTESNRECYSQSRKDKDERRIYNLCRNA